MIFQKSGLARRPRRSQHSPVLMVQGCAEGRVCVGVCVCWASTPAAKHSAMHSDGHCSANARSCACICRMLWKLARLEARLECAVKLTKPHSQGPQSPCILQAATHTHTTWGVTAPAKSTGPNAHHPTNTTQAALLPTKCTQRHTLVCIVARIPPPHLSQSIIPCSLPPGTVTNPTPSLAHSLTPAQTQGTMLRVPQR